MLVVLSERDALEECLQYLKDQLKNGVKLGDLNDSFRKLYEDFFNNQLQMNQLWSCLMYTSSICIANMIYLKLNSINCFNKY